MPTVDEKLCTGCGICEYHCPVLPDHSIVVYTFQEDRGEGGNPNEPGSYVEPHERPLDGFFRGDWDTRKDIGADAHYAPVKAQFDKHIGVEGPQGGGSTYNPNPNP